MQSFDAELYENAKVLAEQTGTRFQQRITELEMEVQALEVDKAKASNIYDEHALYFKFMKHFNDQDDPLAVLPLRDATVVYLLTQMGGTLRDSFNVHGLQDKEGDELIFTVIRMAIEHIISDGYDVFMGTASTGAYHGR